MKTSLYWVLTTAVLLGACSSEEDSSNHKLSQQGQGSNQSASEATAGGAPVINSALPHLPEQPVTPNRSELRVMSEEAKEAESSVKNVIERFDANLSDRQAREAAQNEFKAMLPDYKENMLQIGKAKLKEQQNQIKSP